MQNISKYYPVYLIRSILVPSRFEKTKTRRKSETNKQQKTRRPMHYRLYKVNYFYFVYQSSVYEITIAMAFGTNHILEEKTHLFFSFFFALLIRKNNCNFIDVLHSVVMLLVFFWFVFTIVYFCVCIGRQDSRFV